MQKYVMNFTSSDMRKNSFIYKRDILTPHYPRPYAQLYQSILERKEGQSDVWEPIDRFFSLVKYTYKIQ